MKRLALSIAVVGFFGLAIVCWANDLPPLSCAIKAGGGALALYLVIRVAGKLALGLIVGAAVPPPGRRSGPKGNV